MAGLIQQGEEDDHESPIDRILIECGWASPRTLRNRLQEAKEQGIEDAQRFVVDSMVSVIDASKLQELWETTDVLADRPEIDGFAESNLNGPPVAGAENYAKRRVSELLAEQIECADVVVVGGITADYHNHPSVFSLFFSVFRLFSTLHTLLPLPPLFLLLTYLLVVCPSYTLARRSTAADQDGAGPEGAA